MAETPLKLVGLRFGEEHAALLLLVTLGFQWGLCRSDRIRCSVWSAFIWCCKGKDSCIWLVWLCMCIIVYCALIIRIFPYVKICFVFLFWKHQWQFLKTKVLNSVDTYMSNYFHRYLSMTSMLRWRLDQTENDVECYSLPPLVDPKCFSLWNWILLRQTCLRKQKCLWSFRGRWENASSGYPVDAQTGQQGAPTTTPNSSLPK